MTKRIAIIEDDRDVADLVVHYLHKNGYATEQYHDGEMALQRLRVNPPDLAILDLMLPGMHGLELCRLLRADPATRRLPVIMLTARGEEMDRVLGLEMGADDYITKPFSTKELMARVKAVLRRTQEKQDEGNVQRYGQLLLDAERHVVKDGKKDVQLTAKEFNLLAYLMRRPGRVVSRDQLLDAVWGLDYSGERRTVDVHIRHLRGKIPALVKYIETVKSFGYKLREQP
jgi:two-component system, OmpR family, alkaline phosphatase synthesis response regulator PhoP